MYANISGNVEVHEETLIDTPRWEEVVPQYSAYEDATLDKNSVEPVNFGHHWGNHNGHNAYLHSGALYRDHTRKGSYLRDARPSCMMNGSVRTTAEAIILSGAQLSASLDSFVAANKTKIKDVPIQLPFLWVREAGADDKGFRSYGSQTHAGNNTVASYGTISTALAGDISSLDLSGTIVARSVDLTLQPEGHVALRQTSYDASAEMSSFLALDAGNLEFNPSLLFDPANRHVLYSLVVRPLKTVHFDPVLMTRNGFVTNPDLPLMYPPEMIPELLLKAIAQASAHGRTHISSSNMNNLMLEAGDNTQRLKHNLQQFSPHMIQDGAARLLIADRATEGTMVSTMRDLIKTEDFAAHEFLPHLVCLQVTHKGKECLQPHVYLPTQQGTGLFAPGPVGIHGDETTAFVSEALLQGRGGTEVIAGDIGMRQLVQTRAIEGGYVQHLANPAGIVDTEGPTHVQALWGLRADGGRISGETGVTVEALQARLQAVQLSASRTSQHGRTLVVDRAIKQSPLLIEGNQGPAHVRIGEGGLETAGFVLTGQDVLLKSELRSNVVYEHFH